MQKLQGPALPVKAIGASAVGDDAASSSIDRWQTMQRAHLGEAFASCLSRADVLLALSMLTAEEAQGPVLTLAHRIGRGSSGMDLPIATGAHGLRLFVNSIVKPMGGQSFRVSFRIVNDYMSGVIQIDATKHHLTEAELSAKYERNRRLVCSGLVQMTFMENEVLADPDACAVQVFNIFGIDVKPMVRP